MIPEITDSETNAVNELKELNEESNRRIGQWAEAVDALSTGNLLFDANDPGGYDQPPEADIAFYGYADLDTGDQGHSIFYNFYRDGRASLNSSVSMEGGCEWCKNQSACPAFKAVPETFSGSWQEVYHKLVSILRSWNEQIPSSRIH